MKIYKYEDALDLIKKIINKESENKDIDNSIEKIENVDNNNPIRFDLYLQDKKSKGIYYSNVTSIYFNQLPKSLKKSLINNLKDKKKITNEEIIQLKNKFKTIQKEIK